MWLQIAEEAAGNPDLRVSGLVPATQESGFISRIKGFFGNGVIARASRAN
jgi:hypothetical protein